MMNTYTNEELFAIPMGEPELDISWGIVPRRGTIIPDWMHELQIDWSPNYDSDPTFQCLTVEDPNAFTNEPIWEIPEVGIYRATHEDGRLEQHYHAGPLKWEEDRGAWVSSLDRGYAGRSFGIKMNPDKDFRFAGTSNNVVLRGPWRIAPPKGWEPVNTKHLGVDRGYVFGLELSWAAIANCFYHFFPDHQLAIVKCGSRNAHIQPLHPEYGIPKYLISARRMANAGADGKTYRG